ncbi:unnamed protein product [Parnassius apollo]|uniref:(apollo) hypothetical protein n=1 Tax=Parnassius apollo TaxID=110799 RepID=A0A8S3X9A7_PARAO|nr:unnamed protein product [Parnassius apollo]
MDTKGEGEEMTYPHICFMVDNFDEVFCDIVVRDGEMVCVELVARGRGDAACAVIFLGSIRYDALTRVYDARQSSLSTKMAQRMSFGLLGGMGRGATRCEFVRMKGPGGKGHAEVAVSRPRGTATPGSEPGLAAPWPDDMDDPEDMFLYRHQRRLSDPSANITTFNRGGWRTRDPTDHSRSENDGLDSLMDGVAEVEAGDLRDARRGSQASSARWRCCAGGGGGKGGGAGGCERDMREVYARETRDTATPACLRDVAPRRRPLSRAAVAPPPLRPLPPPATVAPLSRWTTTANWLTMLPPSTAPMKTIMKRQSVVGGHSAGGSKGWSEGARAYVTLPRRQRGVAAALFRRTRLPPRRTTPDGTDIYYWCDLPPRSLHELDDGAYNPLWAMRGFTQTFHLWKEGKRQQSAPLNAYLTYVTLPWWSIAKDILDHREEPILTF